MALRSDSERFRSLTALSADWFWETDPEHRLTWLSGGAPVMMIFGQGAAYGKRFWEAPGVEVEPEALARHLEQIRSQQQFFDLEIARRDERGARVFHIVSGQLRRDAGGNFLGYRGVGRDVTEQRSVERALAAAKERLELALEGGSLATWDCDLENEAVHLGTGWAQVLGRKPEVSEPNAAQVRELMHPDDRATAHDAFVAMLNGEREDFGIDVRVRTARDEWRWLHAAGRVTLRGADGKTRRVSGIAADIDVRKRAEQALREAEERYRALIELAPDGLLVHSGGIIEYANPAAARLFRASSPARLIGMRMRSWCMRRSRAPARAHAVPRCGAGQHRVRGAAAALLRRQRGGDRGRRRVVPRARPAGGAVGAARRERAAPRARGAGRARAALPRRGRGGRRIRLGNRPGLALYLPVGAGRGGARLHALGDARAAAAGFHAARRGARQRRLVRAQVGRRRAVPRPRVPHHHQVRARHLAVGERGAGVRRGGPAGGLPRHRRRHHRAQAGRGEDRISRHARRADRAAQPRAAQRPRQPGDPRRGAQPRPARAAVHRPRSLPAGERLARPPGRRRAAARGRRAAGQHPAARRHAGAAGRGRVRAAVERAQERAGRGGGGAARARHPGAPVHGRRPQPEHRRLDRHRHLPGRRARLGDAAQERRHGDVRRQGRRAQRVPLLRPRAAHARGGAPDARERPAPRARARRAAAALPAGGARPRAADRSSAARCWCAGSTRSADC